MRPRARRRLIVFLPYIDALFLPTQLPYGRILIVTPRRIGNAVQRNQIRRRIKDLFYKQELYVQPYDCACIIKSDALTLSYEQLGKLLAHLYAQVPDMASKSFPEVV